MALAVHVGGDEFGQQVGKDDVYDPCTDLVQDPVFEAAYEDLNPEDKREFPEAHLVMVGFVLQVFM